MKNYLEKNLRLKYIKLESITFNAEEIINILSGLLTIEEKKIYIPKIKYLKKQENSPSSGTAYYIADISIIDRIENTNDFSKYDGSFLIYNEIYNHHQLGSMSSFSKPNTINITFKFLIEEYLKNDSVHIYNHIIPNFKMDSSIGAYVSECDFGKYTYIRSFIDYLVQKRIALNGEELDYTEMAQIIYDFIELTNDNPKTRRLNKNN